MIESARNTLGMLAFALASAMAPVPVGAAIDESLYGELLERYTRRVDDLAGTRVDYANLAADSKWKRLVAELEKSEPKQLRSHQQKLAFWINAYNILAIQTVLDGYPLNSIRDLGSFFSPVWKRKAATIGGQVVSLHQIEHEILRPMKDPRMHAAIVCASTSCPSLRRKPFTEAGIDAELDEVMRNFLADTGKGLRIDRRAGEITLSSIFDWFEEDWAPAGGVVAGIIAHAPATDQKWLRQNAATVSVAHFDYDWRLNDTTPEKQRS